MENSSFSKNEAMYGGAITLDSSATLYSAYASFADNNAFVLGDDIYVDDPSGCTALVYCLVYCPVYRLTYCMCPHVPDACRLPRSAVVPACLPPAAFPPYGSGG